MAVIVPTLAVALSISFLCSLLEACLLSLSNADLAILEGRSAGVGRIWRRFRENLQRPLAVILILNTLAHTIGAALSGAAFERLYGDRWLFAFSLALSFVMIQWTEILPKTLGDRHNLLIARVAGVPLDLAARLLKPVVALVRLLNRPFERRAPGQEPGTREEIRALARHAAEVREIEAPQGRIIAGAAGLSDRRARDLMIPREEVSFLPADLSPDEAIARVHADGHTRYPLCEGGDLDRLAGYVNFKEIVSAHRTDPASASLRAIRRPLLEVRPDDAASDVLRRLVEQHQHIAAVRDVEGRTLGVLTLEDIVEEPLGDVPGEFDRLPALLQPFSETRLLAGGGCRMQDAAARLGLPAGGLEGTVSDWMLRRLAGPPRAGAGVVEGGLRATVRRVRRRKVFEAWLEKAE